MRYDKQEREIINSFESGEMQLSKPSKSEIESIKLAAKNSLKKNKRITLRLYEHDYIGIQEKALEVGIPYQTLISGLIHRYIEGNIQITK